MADDSARKFVLMVMARAQMPTNFTASGFAIISRSTIIFVSKHFSALKQRF